MLRQIASMRSHPRCATCKCSVAILVLAGLSLVYSDYLPRAAAAGEKSAPAAQAPSPQKTTAPKERAFRGTLPPSVEDMREQILAAVHSGDVGELKGAIEWNEIPPDFGTAAGTDPIGHWKTASKDGEGREVLAALGNILSLPSARLAIGRDPENTLVYVWPYLAELPLDTLTPAEKVDLFRLMPVSEAEAMIRSKTWSWWRIAIGADGTWHTFRRY